ncbi:hydroxymethylglutaryl-CoA lyase [Bradyrhizobium japonicum]|uniref:Hydroxymethylglutaryl-CoA lyase n=1 Tax=Bradyrhizobium japonicum TaxID=375 RepID=A0A1L3FES0_BRAJP|nr:hydroxymethylglutaryl-CoA lyase [Bradyrhizobium japonicum]APG11790.1 hydroxymethylglutaryl-CoA lyase [Bradyrhizobium japonicum]
MTATPPDILIQEVAPRDGLQIEAKWVETSEKIRLINSLSAIGFGRIEVSSFVSAAAVPSLRDATDVFTGIERRPGTIYTALIPNRKGSELALAARADELNFVMSASETHNRANMNMTHAVSLASLSEIVKPAHAGGALVNATVATAFGCPFEGLQPFEKVLDIVKRYLDLGVDGVTLADTTGMANPNQVSQLVAEVLMLVPADMLTLHFHNTRGLGLVNVLAAYDSGVRRFDAALGGLGGCPFAPGATGNVCTEDLVNLCHETGLRTGLDLQRLIDLSFRLPGLVGHEVPGQVAKAGRPLDLHPIPERLRRSG